VIARLVRSPVAIAIVLLILATNALVGSFVRAPDPHLRATYGLGAESLILGHDLPTLLTSVVIANGPAELVVVLLANLLVVGLVERRIGHGRALLAFAVTAVAGGGFGVMAQAAGLLTRGVWSTPPADLVVFHPFTPVFGTAMAGSAFAGPLWRRRIRVLGLAGLIIVLLYSGQPGDFYRLAGALSGLALGWLLARDLPSLQFPRSSHHETRTLLAVLVATDAVGPFVAVFQRSGYGILRPLGLLFGDASPARGLAACQGAVRATGCAAPGPLGLVGTVALDVLPLAVLLAAAAGLWNGRRAAAWAAIVVNAVLGALAAIYYNLLPALAHPAEVLALSGRSDPSLQTVLAALLPIAVSGVVGVNLHHFSVRATSRAVHLSAIAVLLVVLVGATSYTVVCITAPGAFVPRLVPDDVALNLAQRYVPFGFLRRHRFDFIALTPLSRALSSWIGPSAWMAGLVSVIACCIAVHRPRSSADEARVRAILRTASTGSIAYMATWAGNSYWFSADGRHAVAYRDASGIALTVGEPIGPPDGLVEAARAFAIACDDRGVTSAFYTVRPEFAAALGTDVPWASMVIGEDTVLNPSSYSMKGKRWQDVRSSINRADRLGVRSVWTDWASLTPAERRQIEEISEEWVADRRLPELGFTLGGLRELRDPEVKLMLAVGPGGQIEGVTSWLPSRRDGDVIGLTLDFMRRRSGSMNGVMEFLIAAVATAAQQRGLEFVSLSVAPLASGATVEETDGVRQLLEAISRILEPAYGFASLAAFKMKFEPSVLPVVLAYPDAVSLPAISIALTRAYLPNAGIRGLARLLGPRRPEAQPPGRGRQPEQVAVADTSGSPPGRGDARTAPSVIPDSEPGSRDDIV
jgi:lysylphosphatidylglycerol synthetase-like protein (DUF2156 family)